MSDSVDDNVNFSGCDLHYGSDQPAFNRNPTTTRSETPRPISVNGKRMPVIDMHAHCQLSNIWPLVEGREELKGENPYEGQLKETENRLRQLEIERQQEIEKQLLREQAEQKEKEEKLRLKEQEIKAAEQEKIFKEKELREKEEESRKEEEKKKRIEEEREIELRRQDEEEERIKEENRRLKEWEDKFDKEKPLNPI